MRGTRDASQDFTGMLPLDPVWTKEVIIELFEHQRKSDGWFPRQISTISRIAPHDMRFFCDGGAYFFGITYGYEGLEIRTCIPREFDECSAQFEYLSNKSTINCHPSENKKFIFNGKEWDKKKFCEEYGKDFPYIADGDMQNENIIDVYC